MAEEQVVNLQPGTDNIDKFDKFYKFISGQVLDEIGRQKKLKKLKQDTTPVVVEENLQNSILSTLTRFNVYDYDAAIATGYAAKVDDASDDDEFTVDCVAEDIREMYPFDIDIKQNHIMYMAKYGNIQDIAELKRKYSTPRTYIDTVTISDSRLSVTEKRAVDPYLISRLKSETDVLCTPNIFVPKSTLCISAAFFIVTRKMSSADALRDMNITTKNMVDMIWGDLIDKAIEIESIE